MDDKTLEMQIPRGGKPGKAALVAAAAATLVLGLGAAAGGAFVAGTQILRQEDRGIVPGVRVAGVDVGGLSREAAEARLRDWARTAYAAPVTLVAPRSGKRWNIALFDAGGRFDIEGALDEAWAVGREGGTLERLLSRASRSAVEIRPKFHLDQDRLRQRVAAVGETIRVPAQSARARMRGDTGVLVVTKPERKGIRLDVDATLKVLLANGANALHDGGKAVLVVREEKPAVTADDLGAVSHLLGSYATGYGSSSASRRHNIQKAARRIDGTLLAPGEVFSYNDTVGPRTIRLGWRDAPTFQDGQVVPGPGGGICQVSTTLYNAILLSGMEIVRRQSHSMPVSYVPAGRDATVAYPYLDLKFRNSTDSPVYVAARSNNGRLSLALYGAQPRGEKKVRIVSGARRSLSGGRFRVTTWRVITGSDGSARREVLSTDTYAPHVEATASVERPVRERRRARPARPRTPEVPPKQTPA